MKIGEIRKYIDEWHCGLYSEIKSSKRLCEVESEEPFLILFVNEICNWDERKGEYGWAKVLFNDKVGFIVISEKITEIVNNDLC